MVKYSSTWTTADIFCQRCHRNRRGLVLQSAEMAKEGISLNLCAHCISEIACETEELRRG